LKVGSEIVYADGEMIKTLGGLEFNVKRVIETKKFKLI